MSDGREIDIRVSDNVLDEEDWGVRRLRIKDGVVLESKTVSSGSYSFFGCPDVGWTVEQIAKWMSYDPTGHHPESYHEVQVFDGRLRWTSDPKDLMQVLARRR